MEFTLVSHSVIQSYSQSLQAPLSRGFSRQEHRSGLPFPSPGSSRPRGWTQVSCTAGRFFTILATREAQLLTKHKQEKVTIVHTTPWMTPKGTLLSERSRSQTVTYCLTPFTCLLEKDTADGMENRFTASRIRRGRGETSGIAGSSFGGYRNCSESWLWWWLQESIRCVKVHRCIHVKDQSYCILI